MSEMGYNGTLSIGTEDATPSSEVTRIKDLDMTLEADKVDDTTRADGGWKSYRAGLAEWGASFTLVAKDGDTVFGTLQNAFKNRTIISASIADLIGNTVEGNVSVGRFSRSEPLADIVTASVELWGRGEPTITNG